MKTFLAACSLGLSVFVAAAAAIAAVIPLTIVLVLSSVPASAASCAAGSLANILGSTCSIGDYTFVFGSGFSQANSVSASDIMFTPNPTPDDPGFTWSGNFALTSTLGTQNFLQFEVSLGIKSYSTLVVGVGAAVGGANVSPGFAETYVQAQSSNWPCNGMCPIAAATVGSYGDVPYDSVTADFTDANSGLVQFWARAEDGGSVSFDSVSFDFKEGDTVLPLPSALPLFATGLGALGLLGWRRKRKNTAALAA